MIFMHVSPLKNKRSFFQWNWERYNNLNSARPSIAYMIVFFFLVILWYCFVFVFAIIIYRHTYVLFALLSFFFLLLFLCVRQFNCFCVFSRWCVNIESQMVNGHAIISTFLQLILSIFIETNQTTNCEENQKLKKKKQWKNQIMWIEFWYFFF